MTWRDASGALRGCSAALAIGAVAVLAQPASAQQYERKLAGVRLNSTASAVLRAFGNPNEVVIGDVGVRQPPQANNGAGQGGFGGSGSAFGGSSSAFGGRGMSSPGGMSSMGGSSSFGSSPSMGGGMSGGGDPRFGGSSGSSGPSGGFSGMSSPGDEGDKGGFSGSSGPSGFGGPGGFGSSGSSGSSSSAGGFGGRGGFGGSGGGVGQFGQTTSTLARQQEVTWIYNRKVNNNLVSYEFLISPNGNVSQIRVSGYSGGNSRTARNIALGSTYKDVVRAYGFPEEHYQVGRILVASYKKKAHVQFQFLNERGTTNTQLMGNKIIAITVAAVE